jgi:hypothetical protein
MFIETSQTKLLAPAERHIESQLEDCRLKIIKLKTLLILYLESSITNRKYYSHGYLLVTYRLLNIGCNITDNMVSISMAIAHKCPILANLRDRIDRKKTFP